MRTTAIRSVPTRSPRPARRVRALALTAAVAAIVLGILGMHALNLHSVHAGSGAHPPDHVGAPAATAGLVAHGHPGDLVDAAASTGAVPAPASTQPDPPTGGSHDAGGMVMLCLAMLTATSALLLVLLHLRRTSRVGFLARVPRPTTLRARRVAAYLPTGPPVVWRFSVVRC
ncbi:hypothetical protein [Nocardioides nanhaiensis]|uniref:Uncharacterized protein n=1 Tax=Nocardioides nanhaiensis TaxID=1476871 RepID=A0ABP8WEF7_9ACTN